MKLPDFKKLFSKKKTDVYQSFSMFKPHHDWRLIITIFISLLIVLISISFFFWTKVKNEDIFGSINKADSNASLINQELMDKTINKFDEKARKINLFPKTSVLTIDPSK